jgi:peptidoglycan/xylan/chitin deacetylase (PgdA/CDA1 family)
MARAALLKTCFDVMHYSGASSILRPVFAGSGVIFCLHHVYPGGGMQQGFAPNAKLAVTPDFLDDIINLVKRQGYELLSLPEAAERLRAGGAQSRPFAVFTLDDGYKDNLVHAAPVFRRHSCPFTVFVSPAIADGRCELWWLALEAMIAGTRHMDVELSGQRYRMDTRDDNQKNAAWDVLCPLLQSMPEQAQRQWVLQWAGKLGVDVFAQCRAIAMNWDDLRVLAKDPLASIGAHTINHFNLMKLDERAAGHEIRASKERIEQELGRTITSFAYPYGNTDAAGPREFALCAEAGFDVSVTTRLGCVFPAHAQHLQALPRIMVSGRFQKLRYIDALVSGVPAALANRFRKLNVN